MTARGAAGTDRRQRPDDAGYSLPELLVALTITSLVLFTAGYITVHDLKASHLLTTKVSTAADGRVAMESMEYLLRTAVAPENVPQGASDKAGVKVAKPDILQFYTLVDTAKTGVVPPPTLVEYYRDTSSNCLVEARTPGHLYGPGPSAGVVYDFSTYPRTTRCLLRTAQVPSLSSPWFTYYTSASATTAITNTVAGLTATDRLTVQSVRVTVRVTDPSDPSVPGIDNEFRLTLGNVALKGGSA